MTAMTTHPVFSTSDLFRVAMLNALGHEPVAVEGVAGRRVFTFHNVPQRDLEAYDTTARPIPPAELFSAYKRMKRLLYR
jgi:hypothetical protein